MEVDMEDVAVAGSPPEMNFVQRIWGILVSPRRTLESLREHPRVLGAILVLVVLNVAATLVLSDLIVQRQVEQLQNRPNVTQEQIDKTAQITRITAPIGALVVTPVMIFIVAGVLFFIGNVTLGGDATYKQMLAGTAYMNMVVIPTLIFRIPVSLAKRSIEVQTSLAAILPQAPPHDLLFRILARFDIFALWTLALGVLVVSVMGRIDVKKAAFGVIVAWVVWSVIVVILQSFIPGFGQM
jgi:hypothetical protein